MSTLKANRIENLTTTDGGIDINNSGNVGVGASSPGANLEVRGSYSNGQIRIGCSTSGTYSQLYSDNDGVLILNADQGNNAASSYLGRNVDNSERLRIDSSGRVGIGTSAPDTKVHVVGSLKVENTSGTGNAWTYYKNADRTYLVGVRGSGSDALSFYDLTADAERMRIDTSGNVVIGRSSALSKLHVSSSNGNADARIGGDASSLGLVLSYDQANATVSRITANPTYTSTNARLHICVDGDANADQLVLDGAGRVGIGTSSPGNPLHIADQNPSIRLQSNSGSYQGRNTIGQYNNILYLECDNDNAVANSAMAFTVDASEAMRISHNGELLISRTGTAFNEKLSVQNSNNVAFFNCTTNSDVSLMLLKHAYAQGSQNATQIQFRNDANSVVGSIKSTASSTSYVTSSDYRLKENVVDLDSAIARVKQLSPKRFNFIVNPETTVDGFLAHEAATVVPEAVTGTHNEVDSDNNPVYQGIDQSKLVPLLTAALQEAIAKIETLETKVAALEAA